MADAQRMKRYLFLHMFEGTDAIIRSAIEHAPGDPDYLHQMQRRHRMMGAVARVRDALGSAATPYQEEALVETFRWLAVEYEPEDDT